MEEKNSYSKGSILKLHSTTKKFGDGVTFLGCPDLGDNKKLKKQRSGNSRGFTLGIETNDTIRWCTREERDRILLP